MGAINSTAVPDKDPRCATTFGSSAGCRVIPREQQGEAILNIVGNVRQTSIRLSPHRRPHRPPRAREHTDNLSHAQAIIIRAYSFRTWPTSPRTSITSGARGRT